MKKVEYDKELENQIGYSKEMEARTKEMIRQMQDIGRKIMGRKK